MNALQLFNACAAGDVVTVKSLLATGIDINRASVAGYAPLHVATMNQQVDVVQELLTHPELDIFLRSTDTEQTALEIAQHDFTEDAKPEAGQCIQLLQRAMCLCSGWLSPRLEGGKLLSTVWEKRYGRVLRTPDPHVLELQLFENDSSKDARAFIIVDTRTAHFDIGTGMSRKSHRFELKALVKGEEDTTRLHRFEFAVESKQALMAWQNVFEGRSKRVSIRTLVSSSTNSNATSTPASQRMSTSLPTYPSPSISRMRAVSEMRSSLNASVRHSPGLYPRLSSSNGPAPNEMRSPWMTHEDPMTMDVYEQQSTIVPRVEATSWIPPNPPFPPTLDLNDFTGNASMSGNNSQQQSTVARRPNESFTGELSRSGSGIVHSEAQQSRLSSESALLLSASSPQPFRSNAQDLSDLPTSTSAQSEQQAPPSQIARSNSMLRSFEQSELSTQTPQLPPLSQFPPRSMTPEMNGARATIDTAAVSSVESDYHSNRPTQNPPMWTQPQEPSAMGQPSADMSSMLAEPGVSAEEQRNFMMAIMLSLAEMQVSNNSNPAFSTPAMTAPQSCYPPSAPTFLDNTVRQRSPDEEATECLICKDAPRCAACIPCGHRTMCMACAQQVLQTSKRCPVCRQPVRDLLKTYG